MKYKALFLDVDGTIIPYHMSMETGLPSARVTESIRKATEKVVVTIATGRPLTLLQHVLTHLSMKEGFAVINDGAQVMDLETGKIIYERVMAKKDMNSAIKILRESKIEFMINDNERDIEFTESYVPYNPYNIFTRARSTEKFINKLRHDLSHISGIKVNKTHAGTGDRFGLLVSHTEATKLHGIYEVQKKLKIKRSQTIGVGDSGNDFPLLMASGLKVAMGNAIPSLKDIADYIAPSVDEDGVVDVINRYILTDAK